MRPQGCTSRTFAAVLVGCLFFATATGASEATYRAALLPFTGAHGMLTEESRVLTDLVSSRLAADPGLQLVERERLGAALSELSLSLSGTVDPGQAVRAGALAGAQILITVHVTRVGRETALLARLLGVETSRVETIAVSGSPHDSLSDLAGELAAAISAAVAARGPSLVAGPPEEVPGVEKLKEALEGRELPSVALSVTETFGGAVRGQSTVETELLWILVEAGFPIFEKAPSRADVLITGEALGHFAARTGDLVSSSVEVRLKAVSSSDRRVLAAARTQRAAADLSAQAAASRAFREAVVRIAPELITTTVDTWND